MKLFFKNTGTTDNLVAWLKSFKDIFPSLLIEIDPDTSEFVAKNFTPVKSIVKYSKLSFEDAGLELVNIIDNDEKDFNWSLHHDDKSDGRIKCGISEILPKFIEVVAMFSGAEHEIIFEFDLNTAVVYKSSKVTDTEYQVNNITFKSKTLTMNVRGSQISDIFFKCDDNTFHNKVCYIGSPSVFEVSIDALNNLMKISSVLKSADSKGNDEIRFYSKEIEGQRALYAYDATNKSYDYLLGYFVEGEPADTAIKIYNENFNKAVKGINAESMRITLDTAGASRLLMTTDDAKIIIGAVNG